MLIFSLNDRFLRCLSFRNISSTFENIVIIKIRLGVQRMTIGFLPLFYYICHIGICNLLIRHRILKWIWPVLREKEIHDSAHENVQNKYIGVCVFKYHQCSCQENPNNNHERNHRNDLFDHSHV